MLIRFRKLRPAVDKYIASQGLEWLRLTKQEWNQLDYLIEISRPFALCTKLIGQTKGPSIHLVYAFFTTIFDLIERAIQKLQRKRLPWKTAMLTALKAALKKLEKYYGWTVDYIGDLYGFGVLLHPGIKDTFWENSSWSKDQAWVDEYWRKLERLWRKEYYRRVPGEAIQRRAQHSRPSTNDTFSITGLMMGWRQPAAARSSSRSTESEFARYRAAGMS